MSTIFSKIAAGEIPSYKVAESADFYAFLDINPVAPGHTLVIPRCEVDYLFDLPEPLYTGLELFARKVAIAMRNALPCKRIAEAVIGLEVPHTHIHLVPINSEADLNFARKLSIPADEMAAIAANIAAEFAKLP